MRIGHDYLRDKCLKLFKSSLSEGKGRLGGTEVVKNIKDCRLLLQETAAIKVGCRLFILLDNIWDSILLGPEPHYFSAQMKPRCREKAILLNLMIKPFNHQQTLHFF